MRIVLDTNIIVSGLLNSQGDLSDYPPDKHRGYAVVSPAAFISTWHKLGGK